MLSVAFMRSNERTLEGLSVTEKEQLEQSSLIGPWPTATESY